MEEEDEVDEVDNESLAPPLISSLRYCHITKEDIFEESSVSKLVWSEVRMLDTRESEMALRTLTQALLEIIQKK